MNNKGLETSSTITRKKRMFKKAQLRFYDENDEKTYQAVFQRFTQGADDIKHAPNTEAFNASIFDAQGLAKLLSIKDRHQCTLLHRMAYNTQPSPGSTTVGGRLLERVLNDIHVYNQNKSPRDCLNIEVNAKDEEGLTPLHIAAHYLNLPFIRLLLAHGANAEAKAQDGRTPLQCAKWFSSNPLSKDVENLLVQHLENTKNATVLQEIQRLEQQIRIKQDEMTRQALLMERLKSDIQGLKEQKQQLEQMCQKGPSSLTPPVFS